MDRNTTIRLLAMVAFIYALYAGQLWFLIGMVAGMAVIITIFATKSTLMLWILKVFNSEVYAGEIFGWQKKNKQEDYIEIKR